MAESSSERSTGEAVERAQERVLLVLIVGSAAAFDDVLTGLLDIGVAGTVIESKGLMALLREEMPVFGGLASMLPDNTGTKIVFSATQRFLADRVFDMVDGEFKADQRPLAFTLPIERVTGLRR
ncbi:MAG: hypothetical protein Tsb0013_14270 [Phycisphaerales bacterium]